MDGSGARLPWARWLVLAGALGLLVPSCAGRSSRRAGGEEGGEGAEPGGAAGAPSGGQSQGARGGAGFGGAGARGGAGPGGASGAGESGAGEGGQSGGGGEGGAGASRPTAGVCREPRAWSSELEACEGDFVHRPAPAACGLPVRDENLTDLPPNAGVENFDDDPACDPPFLTCVLVRNDCTRDADCGAGYCVRTARETFNDEFTDYELHVQHFCQTPCATDADCGADELCTCRPFTQNASRQEITLGTCQPAACRVDADCGAKAFCIASLTQTSPRVAPTLLGSFHCQSPLDECHGPAFCPVIDEWGCCAVPTCEHDGERFVCGERDTCDLCLR